MAIGKTDSKNNAESARPSEPPAVPKAVPPMKDSFATEHLRADLKGRSARGSAITVSAQAVKFVLGLGSTAVLARLLTPADFGLIAMVSALTGFVEMFKDAGLSMATVQRDKVTHAQVSTLFWINVGLSVGLTLFVAALAPVVAWFYGEPELVYVTIAIAGTFIFGGLTVQHTAILKRQMRFTAIVGKEIAAMVSSITVAILLASLGAGYWALVAMPATSLFVGMMLAWSLTRWVPSLPRRGTGVRSMLAFGANLSGAQFFTYMIHHADNVLLGYFCGPALLGFYTRAYSLLTLPLRQFLTPIKAVTVPALSRAQNDRKEFRNIFNQNARIVILFVVLTVSISFAIAPELVRIILGPDWNRAATIFRFLAVGALIQSTNIAGSWVCTATGRTGRQFKVAAVAAPIYFIGFLIGTYWGPEGVAAAFSVVCCALRIPVFKFLLRDTPIAPSDIFKLMYRPMTVGIIGALVAILAGYNSGTGYAVTALIKVGGFSAVVLVAHFCGYLTLPVNSVRKIFKI